jgi:hypothetical protein
MTADTWLEIADEIAARLDGGDLSSDDRTVIATLIEAVLADGDLASGQRLAEILLRVLAYEPRPEINDEPLDIAAITRRTDAVTEIARVALM